MNTNRSSASISLLVFLLAGCSTFSKAPRTPEMRMVKYKMPKVELAEGSSAVLEKDNVKIIVSVEPFVARTSTTVQAVPQSTLFVLNDKLPYEIRRTPQISVAPAELRFTVRVVNNLPNVLKMAGTVVSLTASGKQMPVPAQNYGELIGGIIRPRQEAEYKLVGPSLEALPEDTNLSLALDDVVTAVDAAGNPTKRTSFEWIYAVAKMPQEKQLEIEVETVDMTPAEYRALMASNSAP